MCNKKHIEQATVESQDKMAEGTYLLKLFCKDIAKKARPGNFVNISLGNVSNLLKRPFCIHNAKGDIISLLYKVKGAVTKEMVGLKKGDKVEILGPLGNNFTMVEKKNILLIGGGIGIAPLIYAAKVLAKNNRITVIHGVKSKKEVIKWKDLEVLSHVDDIEGYFVCDNVEKIVEERKIDHVLSCGPMPMMNEIVKTAKRMKIASEVSLEARMACGFGVCLGCVIDTKEGYKKVCVDGPVFKGESLW